MEEIKKIRQILKDLASEKRMFWCTAGKGKGDNHEIGVKKQVWGVKENYRKKISEARKGDYLILYSKKRGITISQILSDPYEDNKRIWKDDVYPLRVRISEPLLEKKSEDLFSVIWKCLKNHSKNGERYKNVRAAAAAIRGSGGTFRKLDLDEVKCILQRLFPNSEREDSTLSFKNLVLEWYSEKIKYCVSLLREGRNILLIGPPGSGKTILAKEIAKRYLEKEDAYLLYTVHGGTDYYDLVARIIPRVKEENVKYVKEGRWVIKAIIEGKVLILDEINRAQIDTALGPFFTYLELPHRIEDWERIVEILKEECEENLEGLREKLFSFRVIGTMNSYDKTFLFKLGEALRRRFHFVEITTDDKIIRLLKEGFEKFLFSIGINDPSKGTEGLLKLFLRICEVKPLGIGILKELLKTYSIKINLGIDEEEALEECIIEIILPFFENDLKYQKVVEILESEGFNNAANRLREMNYELSEFGGI